MKTITLSDKTYAEILRLKNMISMEAQNFHYHITNPEVKKQLQIPDQGSWLIKEELFGNIMWEKDFEPEFTFEKFFKRVISNIWKEQEKEKFIGFEYWR